MSHSSGLADSSPPKPDQPVTDRRIASLDILRGLALAGMVLVHCHEMMGEAVGTSVGGNAVGGIINLVVTDKSRTAFAFLFGVSFAVMMRRLEARELPVVAIFMRRLAILYLIGLATEILTRFSILREYAWWGIALLFLRTYPTRTLLIVALISTAAVSIRDLVDSGHAIMTTGLEATRTAQIAQQAAWDETLRATEASLNGSDYAAVTAVRAKLVWSDIISVYRLTPNLYLTLFILGFLAVRHGIFDDPKRHQRLILAAMALGLACWAAAEWLLPRVPADFATPRIALRLQSGLGVVNAQFLAFTYIGGLTLLLAYRRGCQTTLAAFGWVGKMALTNYLLHIVVIEYACAAYGLNLRLAPYEELIAGVIIFGVLVLLSRFWLDRFRYGPLEWAWRSLTYWRRQPLRIGSP